MTEDEASRMSDDGTEPTGAPEEGMDLEGGLTPEERKMLASLSGTTRPPGETLEAAPTEEPAVEEQPLEEAPGEEPPLEEAPVEEAEGVEVAAEEAEEVPTGAPPRPVERPAPAAAPVTDAPLSAEEAEVLERVRDESERVSREAVPAMFEKEAAPAEAPPEDVLAKAAAMAAAPTAEAPVEEDTTAAETPPLDELAVDETPVAVAAPTPETGILKLLAVALDFINRPFRWVPPVWRMGLGFCGVMLLITLVLVILVRMLMGT